MSAVTTDPMLKRSADSAAMLPYWHKVDAIMGGIDTMRLAGEDFLPRFADEEKTEYDYRLRVTKMTNVFTDSIESLAAKPFEQEVSLLKNEKQEVPETLLKFIEDVDGSGNNLTGFASGTFFNGVAYAIDWIFVDFSKITAPVRTKAEQKAAGLRPYWSHVLGQNVLEARAEVADGSERLTYIRVFEPGATDHIRTYERLPNGVIEWKLYEKRDTARHIEGEGDTFFYEIEGDTIDIDVIPYTPFATGRRNGRTFYYRPSLKDAADLQVEVYQQESGLKYAKQLGAYAMLVGEGVKPEKEADGIKPKRIAVGPGRVLYGGVDASGRAGTWKYIEPSAQTLTFLANDVKETIQQLRELVKQPLTAQSGNLTVITTQVAAGKAKSAVSQWGLELKNALENAFVITCKWMRIPVETYDPVVHVFTEFDEFLEGKDLDDLNTMRSNGDLSQTTYWAEKKRRKVLSTEFDPDAERELLLKETPGDEYEEPPVDPSQPENPPNDRIPPPQRPAPAN